MPSTVTVTGKTGPAVAVTSLVLTGVTEILFQTAPKDMLFITANEGRKEFDLSATTTTTMTISSGVITLTIAQ